MKEFWKYGLLGQSNKCENCCANCDVSQECNYNCCNQNGFDCDKCEYDLYFVGCKI